jgi:hypothetical protein
VVNTVTTLGATFSTTGAKVVIIPSRVCGGCYAGAKHAVPTKNNVASTICVSDRGVSLRIKHSCLQKRIARWRDIGSLFVDARATGVERAVVNAFERGIGQVFRQPARGTQTRSRSQRLGSRRPSNQQTCAGRRKRSYGMSKLQPDGRGGPNAAPR